MIEFDGSAASLFLAGIFEWLDDANIKYCVERNYQGYPERLTGDLDLVVSDHQIEEAAEGITTVAKRLGWFCYQDHIWEKSAYLGFATSVFPKRFALTVELFAGARWHGLPYLSADEVLGQRLRSGITWRPRPSHQAVITSVHHLLYNDHVPEKYRSEIHGLVSEDSESFRGVLSHSFGRKLAAHIANSISEKEWDALMGYVRPMKTSLAQRNLLMNPITTLLTTYMGFRAKRCLPEGVILQVNGAGIGVREKFCNTLLALADRWHLFVPPVRKVIVSEMGSLEPSELDKVSRIMRSGGVAILNCGARADVLLPLTFPIYNIDLHDSQWMMPTNKNNFSNEVVSYSGAVDGIERSAAEIWSNILADRASIEACRVDN